MSTELIDGLIRFFIHHHDLAYLILFLGAFFDTLIGVSFFVWGEIFFLAGSILAGMGVLNLELVIVTLYVGGSAGDNLSYYLGRVLAPISYRRAKTIPVFRRFFSISSYRRSVLFFNKYGPVSVLLGRLLGPLAWITPFLAGQYNVPYRKFLIFDTIGVMLGIGEFIAAGYLFGKHYEALLNLITTYSIVFLFVVTVLVLIYYYLKKSGLLSRLKCLIYEKRQKIVYLIIHHVFIFAVIALLLYGLFLAYIFFIDPPESDNNFKAPAFYSDQPPDINNCRDLGSYYRSAPGKIIQPINIILESELNLTEILDGEWESNRIFFQDHISLRNYLYLIEKKTPPVSSLYLLKKPQNAAYQYRTDSLSRREHIRFWIFKHAGQKQNRYYATISYDDGYDFSFYNYFFTPVHRIDKDIDKSREFFHHYLMKRPDINVQCQEIQTSCQKSKIEGDNETAEEQMYYTDGKILECQIHRSDTEH